LLIEFQKLLCFMNEQMIYTPSSHVIDKISSVLNHNYKVGVSIKKMAEECGISYEKLRKEFPKCFGCSIEKYCIRLRINAAKKMLLDQQLPIKAVAAELGYCDVYAFSNQFKQHEGVSPGRFISNWNSKKGL